MLTQEVIFDIVNDKDAVHYKTEFQEEVKERYDALENHFDEDYPERLLSTNRPAEEGWMKEYRRQVWESPTFTAAQRVKNFISKIQQADDFKIVFESDKPNETGIAENQSLKAYLTEKLPVYKNLEDWLFSVFQNYYLEDPNAVLFVGPDLEKAKYGELTSEPFPQIIESEEIISLTDEHFVFEFDDDDPDYRNFIGIDIDSIAVFRFRRKDEGKDNIIPEILYDTAYPFKALPYRSVGNIIGEVVDNKLVYDSVVSGAIPAWNQALRRADDNNIIWIKYAYPKEWEISSGRCKTCKGSGKISVAGKSGESTCRTCGGEGNVKTETPFNKLVINASVPNALNPNAPSIPTPPAGILERPVDVLQEFREEIDYQIIKGFKALGLENLFLVPLSTSGESKIQDKKEAHTFLYKIAVWYTTIYDWTARSIYAQKFGALIDANLVNSEKVEKALPKITIPTDFDILSLESIGQALALATEKNFGPQIVNGLTRDFLVKQYGENSYAVKKAMVLNKLNPVPDAKPEEITLYKESGIISEMDAMIAVKLSAYINELYAEDDNWYNKTLADQKADLRQLAQADMQTITQARVGRIDFDA